MGKSKRRKAAEESEQVDEPQEVNIDKQLPDPEEVEITAAEAEPTQEPEKIAEQKPDQKEHKKEDDEFSFDFSWVKKGLGKFKKSKHERKPHEHKTKESDEEIQFDVKKIKEFFSLQKHGFNLGTILDFLKKYHVVLLLLIPLFLSFHFRVQTASLPLTDQLATNNVYNTLQGQLVNQINQQYPNLPERQRQELVRDSFQELLQREDAGIKQQIALLSQQYKDRFQDEKGQTYLLAIDPYTYFRQVRNLLDHGHVGDALVDDKPYDKLFLAPIGRRMKPNFHTYFSYVFHKVWSFFDRDVHLLKSFFYVPVIISMLAVIPAFFIARKFGGSVGGFFAAVMVAIHPVFLSRTPAGFSDTDAYNVFFPLLIAWMFIASYDQPTLKRKLGMMGIAGFFVGVYSYAWGGWWYIFGFLLAAGLIHLAVLFFVKFKKSKLHEIRDEVFLFGSYFVSSLLFVSLFSGLKTFFGAFVQPLSFMQLKAAVKGSTIWPNVYTTVAELNPISIKGAINQIGIQFPLKLLFVIAIVGIVLSFLKKSKETKFEIRLTVLLIIWFLGTLYAATKGIRFVMLLVPAFSIAFGTGVGLLYGRISTYFARMVQLDKKIIQFVVLFLFLLLLIKPLQGASSTALQEIPSMTDAWWDSLSQIKEESSPDAIITSWWDFGHWFKAVAERGVTFDGASQTGHNAHFVGRSLLTPNEEEAIGIVRMLDCGQDKAYKALINETLVKQKIDAIRAVDIIKELQLVGKEEARQILDRENIQDPEMILPYTHCTPPEAYYITSEDMTQKAGVWAHFGSWDFRRAHIWQNARELPEEEGLALIQALGYSSEEAEKLYQEVRALGDQTAANTWIAPWPAYGQSSPSACQVKEEMITCGNGLRVNSTTWDAWISAEGNLLVPISLTYFDGKDIVQKNFSNPQTQISGILIPQKQGYSSMLGQPPHAMSLYTRLFYFDGHGLRHFKKVSDRRSVTGVRIIVWKIDWEGGEPRVAFTVNETII